MKVDGFEIAIGDERMNKERLKRIKNGANVERHDYDDDIVWCIFCGDALCSESQFYLDEERNCHGVPNGHPAICVDCKNAIVQGYLTEIMERVDEKTEKKGDRHATV